MSTMIRQALQEKKLDMFHLREERNKIIKKIARDNDFPEHILPVLAGYQRSEKKCWIGLRVKIRICTSSISPMKVISTAV